MNDQHRCTSDRDIHRLCSATFLPAFAVGLYTKTPSTKAALDSVITGVVIWFLFTAFFYAAEAKPRGLCPALFGKVTSIAPP